ncbi:MAG TPA: sulfatase [Spirochaetia bacterium]|nr:sulfatase [Spirochaetia bacterium]
MKAIFVMFDSLNRRFLPPYGNTWVKAPNFRRLAEQTVRFANCYAGSLPCMPARREMHTGRYNFLHCPWGPLEPFDDSMPELLDRAGVYTHLASDHYHYWEDAGTGYNTRFTTWESVRGQEGDPWKGVVAEAAAPNTVDAESKMRTFRRKLLLQDTKNRQYMQDERDMPQTLTFDRGLEFIEANHAEDRWFLQIECFDPHEPFYAPQRFRDLYPRSYSGRHFDWPNYDRVRENPEEVEEARREYAALLSYCDFSLGRVLDAMDRLSLWKDTMLIVGTDHGFLLGEHGWWAKIIPPCYNEIAHIPLFIWDPRSGGRNELRTSLVQTVDLAPTLLDYFGVEMPPDMTGASMKNTIERDVPVRSAALYGYFGRHVCCTDGRYTYLRAPVAARTEIGARNATDAKERPEHPLYEYTVMVHGRNRDRLNAAELVAPLSFTKGVPVMRRQARAFFPGEEPPQTMLFDLDVDPAQEHPIDDPAAEARMAALLSAQMAASDAPPELYERLGLPRP